MNNGLRVTYLKRGDNGWYLRFTGNTDDWNYLKNWLKRMSKGPFKNTWFVYEYRWSQNAKPGAWWVSEAILFALHTMDVLVNLDEMTGDANEDEPVTHSYRHRVYEDTTYAPPNVQHAYALMKLPLTANQDQIKKTYRTLAFTFHPDHGGDETKMKELNVANDVITAWMERVA